MNKLVKTTKIFKLVHAKESENAQEIPQENAAFQIKKTEIMLILIITNVIIGKSNLTNQCYLLLIQLLTIILKVVWSSKFSIQII